MIPLVLLLMPCVQHEALESAVLHVSPFEGPRQLQIPKTFCGCCMLDQAGQAS